MKEIGGYFQLEEMPGEEYYPDLYRVNLGRTALLWLLKSRRCRKILLPYFLCESVVHTCQENQIETEFYHLNEKLEVLYPKEQLPEGEYLYLVNYIFSETIKRDRYTVFLQKILGCQRWRISVNRCQPDRK